MYINSLNIYSYCILSNWKGDIFTGHFVSSFHVIACIRQVKLVEFVNFSPVYDGHLLANMPLDYLPYFSPVYDGLNNLTSQHDVGLFTWYTFNKLYHTLYSRSCEMSVTLPHQ
jgi:hypothetical protein